MSGRSVCGEHWLPEPCAECEREGKKEREAIRRGEKPCPICGEEVERLEADRDEIMRHLVRNGLRPDESGHPLPQLVGMVLSRLSAERDDWAQRSAKWALELDGPNGNDGIRAQLAAAREALKAIDKEDRPCSCESVVGYVCAIHQITRAALEKGG